MTWDDQVREADIQEGARIRVYDGRECVVKRVEWDEVEPDVSAVQIESEMAYECVRVFDIFEVWRD